MGSMSPENKPKQTKTSRCNGRAGVKDNFRTYLWMLHSAHTELPLLLHYVCVCVHARMSHNKEKGTAGDKMCPSSLCNYLPIFSPSVAIIIPFRSHLGVGDCHSVAPPSLNVCRMKCRSPPIDLCLPAPTSLSPFFVSL